MLDGFNMILLKLTELAELDESVVCLLIFGFVDIFCFVCNAVIKTY